MLLYRRPDEPEGFAERMRPFRERVEASVRAGDKPTFEDAEWRRYKQVFAEAQQGKCGYCEVMATEIGDVEHFRPKGAISELYDDPETWGQVEARNRSRVGFETIRTLGLDRPQLQRDREEKAQRTYACTRRLQAAETREDVSRILRDISTMGNERYPHAGMVRIVFEQLTGLPWPDVESWIASLR